MLFLLSNHFYQKHFVQCLFGQAALRKKKNISESAVSNVKAKFTDNLKNLLLRPSGSVAVREKQWPICATERHFHNTSTYGHENFSWLLPTEVQASTATPPPCFISYFPPDPPVRPFSFLICQRGSTKDHALTLKVHLTWPILIEVWQLKLSGCVWHAVCQHSALLPSTLQSIYLPAQSTSTDVTQTQTCKNI